MKRCPKCDYPNPESRTTCFNCQESLPDQQVVPRWQQNIFTAVKSGDLQEVISILQSNPSLVSAADSLGRTPLYWASSLGHRDLVAALIKAGADPNAWQHTKTPSSSGSATLLSFLYGSPLPLMSSIFFDGIRSSIRSTWCPLYHAAANGHTDTVRLLLDHGAEVDAVCGSFTALHAAAMGGHKDVVELLLANGANFRAGTGDILETTPLGLAVRRHHMEVADLLRQHGACELRLISKRGYGCLVAAGTGCFVVMGPLGWLILLGVHLVRYLRKRRK